jgi:pSer/pThr/pTyr-binding forkhead associated (FHA) protein
VNDASRVFWLKRTSENQSNVDTLYMPSFVPSSRRCALGELFFELYDPIRDWVHERTRQGRAGLAVVAFDDNGIQAKGYLRSDENRVNSAIIGRHEKADIHLGDDVSLSLRHLAVLVSPASDRNPMRVRVVDLRTASGFADERGTGIRACEAERPFVFRCGRYSILCAPVSVGDDSGWPDEPEVMWARLRGRDAASLAVSHPATLDDGLLYDGEEALGALVISSEEGTGTIPVGRRAARSGILLGRSDRCDGDTLLANPHISRVHALIVELAGSLYAVDTASKNGVWGKHGEQRAQLLESGTKFSLCGLAQIEWRFWH